MGDDSPSVLTGVTRRAMLGTVGTASTLMTAGCIQEARGLLSRDSGNQISLTIKTVPADEDRMAVEIARYLENNLEAVGIDTDLVLLEAVELFRDVLIKHDFDIYVARSPEMQDPDVLRTLLHSRYNSGPGWLNPFGVSDLSVDELLSEQRRQDGMDRRNTVYDLQRQIASFQPFAVIGFPDDVRTARTDRFDGWSALPLRDPLSFLSLRSRTTDNEPTQLRVVTTDARVTNNFNPIAVEHRNRGTFVELVYDSIGRWYEDSLLPWMARDWSWEDHTAGTTATVTLRSGLKFHDDAPVMASDVAFTYRFMSDTTLGNRESPIPAPRYRGPVSLVDSVKVLDRHTLKFEFANTSPQVARRAFTVPVLPAHEWEPRTNEVTVGGITPFDGITEALIWQNPEPVGSGVLQFDRRVPDELVSFHRFEGHFLDRTDEPEMDETFGGGVAFDTVTVRVAPADSAAIELVAAGEVDATVSSVDPSVVPNIGRNDDLQLLVDPSRSFYHVGFNARRGPLGNSRFRRALSSLIDASTIASEIFDAYLEPSAVPLEDRSWVPPELRWFDRNPEVPFIGSNGELNVSEAREQFREAGFRYSGDGELREG